ncbi:MAG: four helix bundle protein [Planctomycetes bacterium]|nr:four helix bundle protein [Planctomycetota bacterium]
MANVRTFRDLIAWQKSMELARILYVATRVMPNDERFGLTSQMRRAAVSVPSNIAEGFGRESRADLLKYLRIVRGSLNEVATQYELATSMQMIPAQPMISDLIEETDRVLQGLITSLKSKSQANA